MIMVFCILTRQGISIFEKPSNSTTWLYVLSEEGRVMSASSGKGVWTRRILSGNRDAAVVESVHNTGVVTRQEVIRMQSISSTDFNGKQFKIVNGCGLGVDAIYSINATGYWGNTCGDVGRIFLTTVNEYCSTSTYGSKRPIPNVMCFMNVTRNTASMVALKSGSFNSGGNCCSLGETQTRLDSG